MKVTKKWCSNCEGEGHLVDVTKEGGETENAWPASAAREINNAVRDGEEPSDYAVVEASAPYPCSICGGPGFYFYIDDEDRFGESIRLDELSPDAELRTVKGPEDWTALHRGRPVGFMSR